MATKEQILQAQDRKTATVEVPEWETTVTIKSLSAYQKDVLDSFYKFDAEGKLVRESTQNQRARLAALSIVNDDGSPMFTIAEALQLGDKSAEAVDRIAEAARKLNGFDKDDTVKNSSATTEG